MKEQEYQAELERCISKIKPPEGFTIKRHIEKCHYGEVTVLTVDSPTIVVKFDFVNSEYMNALAWSGHTSFLANGIWFTFDRRGVEDSFYGEKKYNPQKQLIGQIEKAKEAIKRNSEAIPVPGLSPYTITPDRKAQIISLLKSGKSYTFRPSGFGWAHVVSTKPTGRYCKQNSVLATFLGLPKVYVDSYDMD